MKIVLVRPPFYALFGVTTPKMKTYPLNLLYLATYVRDRAGSQAEIVDGENISIPELAPPDSSNLDPEEIMHQGIPRMVEIVEDPNHPLWEEMERQILSHKPDIVGITCNSVNMDAARCMVKRLKDRGLPVILGGSHPTVLPVESIAYTNADMVAIGEAEHTLARVMDALSENATPADIPSLAWRENGELKVNPRGPLVKDIDQLPIPDRSLVDRADYFGEVILTSRGCPFNCAYCASRNIWGKSVRFRSIQSIIGELHSLKRAAQESAESVDSPENDRERPGRWVVKIIDDTFTVSRKRALDFFGAIASEGLNCFEYTGGVRADSLDETLVNAMAAANVRRVTLGVESGSPKILKMIRKGETNEEVKRAVGLLRNAGIKSHAFFMIGFPGETPEDIELSKRLIEEAKPDHVEINMVTPYPGTDLFPMLLSEEPADIDRWHRWFHQGMSTHSDRIGYDLDKAYEEFLSFARDFHDSQAASKE